MLTKLCVPLKLEGKFDFHQIAHNTPGYVAADLVSLVSETHKTLILLLGIFLSTYNKDKEKNSILFKQ